MTDKIIEIGAKAIYGCWPTEYDYLRLTTETDRRTERARGVVSWEETCDDHASRADDCRSAAREFIAALRAAGFKIVEAAKAEAELATEAAAAPAVSADGQSQEQ